MDSYGSVLYCKTNVFLYSVGLIWGLHFIALLSAACFVMRTKKRFGEVLSTTTAAMTSALLWIIAYVTVHFLTKMFPDSSNHYLCWSRIVVSCFIMLKKINV